jgi:hypothetical protein
MINPPMGVIQNPINFQVNLSYNQTELVRCDLKLNEINKNNLGPHEEFSWNFNLENGAYDWKINCSDLLNPKFNDSKEGVFVINEDITDVSLNRLHLLGEVVSLSLPQGYSNADIKIIRPDTTTITQNFNTNQITLGTDIINTWGNYTLNISATNPNKPQYVTLRTFSVVELNIWTNKNSAQTNEEMTFRAEVNSPISIQGYTLNLIENNKQYDDNVPGKEFKYTYSTAGDYATSLRVSYFPGGEVFQTTKQILISNFQDTSEPQITLDAPKNNAYIIKEPVEFRYSVSDDSKISRCTYELYRVIDGTETLDYDQTDNNIQSGGEIEIILRDFDNSKYSWYVFCCDDQSNCNGELEYNREFTFNLGGNSSTNPASSSTNYSNHENKDEIDEIIDRVDDFEKQIQESSLDIQEALEDLGISENLTFYKRRLIQIDQDLGTNLRFIEGDDKREERKEELTEEYQTINSNIPSDIKIIDSQEFVKNSLTNDLNEVLKNYFEFKVKTITTRQLKAISELIYEEQTKLSTSTLVQQIRIDYPSNTKEITLVKKEISLTDNSYSIVLEVIPKEIAAHSDNVFFLTENKIVNSDPIFEINLDDLSNDEIVYYIEDLISTDKFKETETILYKEIIINDLGITGFSIFPLDGGYGIYSIILLIILGLIILYLLYDFILKYRVSKWKKQENVSRVYIAIKKAKREIKNKQIDNAKINYHIIKENFSLTPIRFRKYVYKDIKKIQIAIDKKDIFDLIKEYETAKKENRLDDANEIYMNIQGTYKRLPKQDREIVYLKLFKKN